MFQSEFEVPQGMTAINLRYHWTNAPGEEPAQSDRLDSLYDMTSGSYVKIKYDAGGRAITQLPAGKYRFFVGGKPGARGILTYDLEPGQ
jgi:hypothetical protein